MHTALVALAFAAACHAPVTPSNAKEPEAGVSIALYADGDASYSVVDDRRWVEVAGTSLLLANIDPGAALASLAIESGDPALHVGACTRERMPDIAPNDPRGELAASDHFVPVVTCEVTAKPGRYLVRLLYVTNALGYRAQHDIEVIGGARAEITSRYAISTPVWQTRAELVLYEGVPGGEHAPHELGRGQVTLDGSTSVITTPARQVESQIRRVYEGAVVTSADSTELDWGRDSVQAIWVWLELPRVRLAPGPVHVHLDLPGEGIRDLDVLPASRKQQDTPGAPLRLPLWVDESLRGSRQRIVEYNDGASISERYVFGVANTGESARDVWVEEPMRRASKRTVDRSWPKKPSADRGVLRTRLDVRPGRMERTGYTLTYEF